MGYTLGIDLGTTFTAAAIARDGRAEVVPLGNHAAAIPSLVFLREDESVLIGDAAERRGQQEPSRLAREFKRRFGDTTPILLDRTPFSAERLMALLLRQILADIDARQGGAPDRVGLAHPANWGQFKIDLLRQAAQLSGLHGATFVTEPVAAAIQYASSERVDNGDIIAVYDLGGGTFDAAVLRKTPNGFETMGQPQGIERLGGIDFDEAIFGHVRRAIGDAIDRLDTNDPSTRSAVARLRAECVAAKETLSSDSDATISVLLPNVQTQVRVTRGEFEEMIRPTLRETVETTKRAIALANTPLAEVKAVLLAGGSSRIPLVAEMVRSELGRPVVSDLHPKHAVALGAARVAAGQLTGATIEPAVPPLPPAGPVGPPPPGPPPTPSPVPAGPPPPPPPQQQPAAAAYAPTQTQPAQPTPARTTPAPPPGRPRPTWKKPWVLLLLALVAVGVGVGAAVVVTSGDDDDGATVETTDGGTDETEAPGTSVEATSEVTTPGTTETTTTSADTTTTVFEPEFVCGASGRCVRIKSITDQGVGLPYLVTYQTQSFEPFIGTNPNTDFHVHFFWNTLRPDQAGTPEDVARWVAWGLEQAGGSLFFDQLSRENADDFGGHGATAMCIAVAHSDHSIEEDTVMCLDLAEPVP